jgi:urease accessory protein
VPSETSDRREARDLELQHWFSPAFPVGGYAYSHGIERAVEAGLVTNAVTLAEWIEDIVAHGTGPNDCIFLAEAFRVAQGWQAVGVPSALSTVAQLALALGASSERRLETLQQGAAFRDLQMAIEPMPCLNWFDDLPTAFPIVVGVVAAKRGHQIETVLPAYLQAFAANLFAAGIRLAVIGQTEVQKRVMQLRPLVLGIAREAAGSTLDDLGSMSLKADLMVMQHETQIGRLFRS